MRRKVTLAINAGLVLELGHTCIWIDVLHDDKAPRFSTVTPELADRIIDGGALPRPDLLLYTHCHRDHYSRGLTQRALEKWPDAALILPQEDFPDRQILLAGEEQTLDFRGLQFRFGRLTHQGADFAHILNYGCIINAGGFRILTAGDCTVDAPELEEFVGQEHIDLALLGFPFATRPSGREIIDQMICPDRLVLCHLPSAEDDWAHLRPSVAAGMQYLRNIPDVQLLQDPFTSLVF